MPILKTIIGLVVVDVYKWLKNKYTERQLEKQRLSKIDMKHVDEVVERIKRMPPNSTNVE